MVDSMVNTVRAPRDEYRVVAVVVTYNREHLLPGTLAGLASGRRRPDAVVLVDNASTDGTAKFLASLDYELPLDIVSLSANTGGAGGFAVGIDRALERHNPDLVWVMDDDTEPGVDTLAEAVRAWVEYAPVRAQRPAVVASAVQWSDGRDHPMNTMRTRFMAGESRTERAAAVGARPIRSGSFVALLMDAQVIRQNGGLPWADFFIWNDDFEFSTRLIHHREGIAVPSSVAAHHTKTFGTTDAKPGPRFYNDVRNKLWVFTRCRTLSPLEKVLYGGSSARLWLSTLLKTDEKGVYAGYLARGVRDALSAPRSNAQVLQGVYPLTFSSKRYSVPAPSLDPVSSTDFSLLMSVYAKDNPEFVQRALESNLLDQSLPPSELVLVCDGPLTAELEQLVAQWQSRAAAGECPPIVRVQLPVNAGLAAALNEGLEACSYELVARADSDDISEPNRFEQLIPELVRRNVALLGSAMTETGADGVSVERVRAAITNPDELLRVLPKRNPFYHPSVAFRKSAVERVGAYEFVPGAEDWWLWCRLADAGYTLANIDRPLVRYRVGAGAYTRRGGVDAWKQDWAIQRRLYTGHAISKARWVQNMAVRSVYRFVPESARRAAFGLLSSNMLSSARKES